MALASVTDVGTVHTPGAPLPEGHFAAFPPAGIMPGGRRVRTGLHLRRSTYAPGDIRPWRSGRAGGTAAASCRPRGAGSAGARRPHRRRETRTAVRIRAAPGTGAGL